MYIHVDGLSLIESLLVLVVSCMPQSERQSVTAVCNRIRYFTLYCSPQQRGVTAVMAAVVVTALI